MLSLSKHEAGTAFQRPDDYHAQPRCLVAAVSHAYDGPDATPAAPPRRETPMKDHLHIRNPEAAQLARTLARQSGKTITETVLHALRQYRPPHRAAQSRQEVEAWRRLLRADRKPVLADRETPADALYGDDTGLPQ
jgi:hypothetical protein